MKQLILIVVLAGMWSQSAAQLLPFRSYSIEKGLSEAVVNDLMQDNQGCLWIATGYGLNRFDGIKFKNYYEEDGLLNNKIYSLFLDREERVWVGTGAGINVIEGDSIQTIPALKPLRSSTILEIFQDTNGDYWFATDGEGVWHYEDDRDLTQYLTVHGIADDRVRDVVEDPKGILWFATRGGLTSLESGNFRNYTTADGLPENRLRDLALGKDGSLWIATRGGLSHLKNDRFINHTEKNGLINNRIQSLSPDENGNVWIGTEEGASHFNSKSQTFRNYSVEQGLSNNIIYATLHDRENNIWFGTFGGGISVFLGEQFKNYTVDEGLPNPVVTSITQDTTGHYWITTYGGGITQFDGQSFKTYTEKNGLVDNKVYTAIVDNRNRLMIGTRWGLSIYNGSSFFNYDEQELPYRKIRAVAEAQNHEEYWMGTYGEGVLRLKDGKFRLFSEQDGLANNTVMAVEQSKDGALWFATYGGVSRYRYGSFTNYTIRDGLPNNGVLDILKDKDGDLWFSTFGGLAKFENGSLITITSEDGLPDEVCYFIIQDDNGIYWIGTNKGVVRFDYEKYQELKDSKDQRNAFKLLTQEQGLISNEMNAGASFKDKQGNLWFGSVDGLTRFNPKLEKINRAPPKIHIEDVEVSGEPVEHKKGLQIESNNQNITFRYIGISFTAPEQVVYEYRLKGSGEDWQRTSQRSVRYSALLSGDYTFQVKAQNSDGLWSTETASLSFTVLAPFWRQWWFIILVFFGLGGIVFFVYNYYRVRKMVEIERMRVRIASDLHDDVGSALTEIALQSDFLKATEVDNKLKKSLDQIGTQSRKIVSSLDDIVWSIDARNDTLGDLTDRMQDYVNNVLPQKEVFYQFDNLNMGEKLTVQMKENLYLIFKEAINNIAKHSDATRVKIELKDKDNSFDLLVSDNGKGTKQKRKTGHGLRNMKMRAQRIDAAIDFINNDGFTVHVYGNGIKM